MTDVVLKTSGAALGYVSGGIMLLALAPFGYALDSLTRLSGTLPVFHWGKKFGMSFKDIPKLQGKVYIVTGANSGLGFGSTKLLAANGAKVVMACRSLERGEEAKATILKEDKNVKPEQLVVMELDNASLKSVKNFARAFKQAEKRLDGLVLNAGGVVNAYKLTQDGLEMMFGVNHVAHQALTMELLDMLKSNQPHATVVSVASIAHYTTVPGGVYLDVPTMNDKKNFAAWSYYGQSKLCNILFARELTKRLGPDSTVYVNSVHPGGVTGKFNAGLYGSNRFMSAYDQALQQLMYWTEEQAALTVIAPLVSPKVTSENQRGMYFVPIARTADSSNHAKDAALASKVWDFTEAVLREKGWDSM